MRDWRIVIGILFIIVLAGCASAATPTAQPEMATVAPSPTTGVTTQPTPSGSTDVSATPHNIFAQTTRVPTTVPTAAPPFAPNLLPAPPLTEEGALLLFEANRGGNWFSLWAVRAGGGGLIELTPDENLLNWAVTPGEAPGTGILAYMTEQDRMSGTGLMLTIMDIPSRQKRLVLPLTSETTAFDPHAQASEDEDFPPKIDPWNIYLAIERPDSIAWSPDGTKLAFVGAMNGNSADIYLYDRASGAVTQITSGDAQANELRWSPDGRFIAHFAFWAVGGGGYSIEGLYIAKVDGSGSVRVPDHPAYPSGTATTFTGTHGWLSDDTAIVWDDLSIRSYNVTTGQTAVYSDGYARDAVIRPGGPVVTYLRETDSRAEGVYLLQADQSPTLIASGAARPRYLPALDAFLVGDSLYSPDGTLTELSEPAPSKPFFSPDGTRIAWSGTGLWLGEFGAAPVQVSDEIVGDVIWAPDGSAIYYFTDEGFYRLGYPNVTPQLIGDLKLWYLLDSVWVP